MFHAEHIGKFYSYDVQMNIIDPIFCDVMVSIWSRQVKHLILNVVN